ERRYGTKIPVRRGDTGLYWEDGAASTAAELAEFRAAQLVARAAEIAALWETRIEPRDDDATQRRRSRAEVRTAMWRDLLLFGEHTWGADESVSAPTSRQTVAQWEYKKRFIDVGVATARDQLNDGLLRLGRACRTGRGRLVFNAGSWERTDVVRVPGGGGKSLSTDGRELASVDLENGDALVLFREVPPLGYLALTQAKLVRARRERLPGIGVRLVIERALDGFPSITSSITLYDELPWVDIENRIVKTATLTKEALYFAFPFAFLKPVVDVEVPLGRMTVERDQQPGSCRDWYCHTHWVWLHEGNDGVLWSGPDTPLFTLNDLFRGAWRRTIVPDGTLFAYVMNNYWHTNYAASQGGAATFRFRLSLVAPGDAAEPVRRGWAACEPLHVSPAYT